MAIHELRFSTKYIFTLVILQTILNPQIKMFTNMSNVVKPQNFVPTKLNDFTVYQQVTAGSHCTVGFTPCMSLQRQWVQGSPVLSYTCSELLASGGES